MYTIETVVFDARGRTKQKTYPNQWDILLKGFKSSSKNTKAEVNVHKLPKLQSRKRTELCVNNYKLKKWRDIVYAAESPMVLSDTDICFLDDIADGFTEMPITLTSRAERWCNAGLVFVQPCQEARDFFDRWCEMDDWVHEGETDARGNPKRLKRAWKETGVYGHNQTSLALIRDEFAFGWVSGEVYNASLRQEWQGNPKAVHVKDSLRKELMGALNGKKVKNKLVNKIVEYYR